MTTIGALGQIATLLLGYFLIAYFFNRVRGVSNPMKEALTGVYILGGAIIVLGIVIALYLTL